MVLHIYVVSLSIVKVKYQANTAVIFTEHCNLYLAANKISQPVPTKSIVWSNTFNYFGNAKL